MTEDRSYSLAVSMFNNAHGLAQEAHFQLLQKKRKNTT